MKAYVATTGLVFAALTLVHVWRFIEEGEPVLKDPWFVAITAVSAVLALWALRLLRAPK